MKNLTPQELGELVAEIATTGDAALAEQIAALRKLIEDVQTRAASLESRVSRHGEHLRKLEDWKQAQ